MWAFWSAVNLAHGVTGAPTKRSGEGSCPGGTAKAFGEFYHVPLPDVAVWIAVIIELVGGLMILVGFQTRWVALVLAIFCLGTGFGAHLPIGDVGNMINFYKNLVMAGGFLYVAAYGPGGLSVDHATGMEKA
ncbi:MAG TPA: DoxX family protein [Xanthobacteraceae bacterium]